MKTVLARNAVGRVIFRISACSLEPTLDRVQTLRNAYDFIITFLEGVVESTADLQTKNRELLRCEILKQA